MTPGDGSTWDESAWDEDDAAGDGDAGTDGWDGRDSGNERPDASERDVGRAPICPECGVTALPAEPANVLDATFVCDNAECEAFGQPV